MMDRIVTCVVAALGCALGAVGPATGQVSGGPLDGAPGFEPRPEMEEVVRRQTEITEASVASLRLPAARAHAFRTAFPFEDAVLTMELSKHSVRARDFTLYRDIEGVGLIEVEPGESATYRGTIEEIPGSVVAGSLSGGGLIAKVFFPDGEVVMIEPLRPLVVTAREADHVIYRSSDRDSDIVASCGTPDIEREIEDAVHHAASVERGGIEGLRVAQIVLDTDFEFIQQLGDGAMDRVESILNAVNVQYERDVDITHEARAIILRENANDPYAETSSGGIINELLFEWAPDNNQEIIRDVVHLFTGKDIDGSTIGRAATIGGICTTLNVAVSQTEFTNSFLCSTDLVAHEIGHLWDALHCDCPSNTMNTPLVCANVFSEQRINDIIAYRDAVDCLSAPEVLVVSLPFDDSFPETTIDPMNWIGINGSPEVNADAIDEPSGSFSLNISGTDELRSAFIDTSLQTDVTVSYKVQRTGFGDSPEPGEDLILEFLDGAGDWQEIDRLSGDGADMTAFLSRLVLLPPSAEHEGMRIRFRISAFEDGQDDYFVDDVSISTVPIFPGAFDLSSPAEGAEGLSPLVLFQWNASSFATGYNLQVDDDSDFSSPVLDTTTGSLIFFNPGFQLANGVYHWRVFAQNVNGQTVATEASRSFRVGAAPPPLCPGDCDENRAVDFSDLVTALGLFGQDTGDACDADQSGVVDFADLVAMLGLFGPCP